MKRSADKIKQIILDSRLGENFSVRNGDCASIAVAIQRAFDGSFVGLTAEPDGELPCHVAVEINGQVYDGFGQVSLERLAVDESFLPQQVREDTFEDYYWTGSQPPEYMVSEDIVRQVYEWIISHPKY